MTGVLCWLEANGRPLPDLSPDSFFAASCGHAVNHGDGGNRVLDDGCSDDDAEAHCILIDAVI